MRQLRAFESVAEHASFVLAARALCITQSALSGTIKQLEAAIGLRLFDRTTRSVGLTDAGADFLEDVHIALGTLEQGLQRMSALSTLRRGEVRVAAAPSALATLVLPCVADLLRAHPGIRVTLREEGADGIARCVREREVDFAIGAWHGEPVHLRCEPLLEDRIGVVGRRGDPLLRRREVAAGALEGVALVGLTPDTAISRLVNLETSLPAAAREPSLQLSNTLLMPEAIKAGLGVALVPALVARHPAFSGLVFRPLATPCISRRIAILREPRRGLSSAAAALHAAILDRVQALAPDRGIALRVAG